MHDGGRPAIRASDRLPLLPDNRRHSRAGRPQTDSQSVALICAEYLSKFLIPVDKPHWYFTDVVRFVTVTGSIVISWTLRKASSLDIVPLTILDSGALQPPKWQLTGNDCSTAAHAVAARSPR